MEGGKSEAGVYIGICLRMALLTRKMGAKQRATHRSSYCLAPSNHFFVHVGLEGLTTRALVQRRSRQVK